MDEYKNLVERDLPKSVAGAGKLGLSKGEIDRKYFGRKWFMIVSVIQIVLGVAVCVLQVLVLILGLQRERTDMSPLEYGPGFGCTLISIVSAVITLLTRTKATYFKLLLTLTSQFLVLGCYIGLVVVALYSWLSQFVWQIKFFGESSCIDASGYIYKAAIPLKYDFYDDGPLGCIDRYNELSTVCWLQFVTYFLTSIAAIQALMALVPLTMVCRTLWSLRAKFDHAASNSNRAKIIEDPFPEKIASTIAWTQLSIAALICIAEMLPMRPRSLYLWNVMELFGVGSYVLLNWVAGKKLTYFKQNLVLVFHVIGVCAMLVITSIGLSDFGSHSTNFMVAMGVVQHGLGLYVVVASVRVLSYKLNSIDDDDVKQEVWYGTVTKAGNEPANEKA